MADPVIDSGLAVGILVIGGGLLLAAFPGPIATMDETTDAIGSNRSGEQIQPSRWKLLLTRAMGIGIAIVGTWYLVAVWW